MEPRKTELQMVIGPNHFVVWFLQWWVNHEPMCGFFLGKTGTRAEPIFVTTFVLCFVRTLRMSIAIPRCRKRNQSRCRRRCFLPGASFSSMCAQSCETYCWIFDLTTLVVHFSHQGGPFMDRRTKTSEEEMFHADHVW